MKHHNVYRAIESHNVDQIFVFHLKGRATMQSGPRGKTDLARVLFSFSRVLLGIYLDHTDFHKELSGARKNQTVLTGFPILETFLEGFDRFWVKRVTLDCTELNLPCIVSCP